MHHAAAACSAVRPTVPYATEPGLRQAVADHGASARDRQASGSEPRSTSSRARRSAAPWTSCRSAARVGQLVDQDPHRGRARPPSRPGTSRSPKVSRAMTEREVSTRLLAHRDDVVLLDPVRRDVDPLAVDHEVAVRRRAGGPAAGPGEAGAVDDVVEPGLEDLQQVVTGLAGAVGLLVVPAELLLQHAVGEAGLLLLLQLERGTPSPWSGRGRAAPGGKGRSSNALSPPTRSTPSRRDFLVMGPV